MTDSQTMPDWQSSPITKRLDGSFVITKSGLPYHVLDDGEFIDLWTEVNTYTLEHAITVTEEQPPPPPTPEQIQKQFTDAIQARLDAFARTKNYDGILSAASYATSTNPQFRAEGQYAVEARDATWAAAYAILGAVLAGERPMPTLDEVMAELPELAWPEAA